MSVDALEVPAPVVRDVIALRRDFHAHPELGFEEVRTAGIVAERLRALGYQVRTGVGQTGVLGILRSQRPGKTILLRADMDCLPIDERSGVEFSSTVAGKMHACGHDGHTAMLLGAAQMIMERRDLIHGTIVLCFQPAEEGKGGARAMIEDGALDDPAVDRVYGLHLTSLYPTGQVLVRPGPVMASSDSIEVTIRGRGGHGAAPHQTVDPIVTSAYFIAQLQSVASRNVDPTEPAVVTIGAIHGGTIHNVIPDSVDLLGTVRAFSEAERAAMKPRIERVLSGCCDAAGAGYDYRYIDRYPITVNDEKEAGYVHQLAVRTLGERRLGHLAMTMGAEDFSFMLQRRPGCFFFLGSQSDERTAVPHHNARFAIDERCLATGVQMMTALALDAPQRP
ncbi:MAG: amidohydrolase [Candidatus Eremiobacteraeota bacterium]|nr:amidohydrolase [Candidatus Eremiobacteraeota bacterium]MBV8366382.1 amidohydrolase [Candidatus Eremiobacteraeota bacterium]